MLTPREELSPACVLSLTCNLVSQREGNKLRTAQNTKLRKILRLKREGEKGRQKESTIKSFIICIARQILGWSSEGQLERWGIWHAGAEEKCTSFVVEKTWRKQTTKRTWRTRYNIKMVIKETRWEGVGRVHLAQDRKKWRAVVNTVMKYLAVQKRAINWPLCNYKRHDKVSALLSYLPRLLVYFPHLIYIYIYIHIYILTWLRLPHTHLLYIIRTLQHMFHNFHDPGVKMCTKKIETG